MYGRLSDKVSGTIIQTDVSQKIESHGKTYTFSNLYKIKPEKEMQSGDSGGPYMYGSKLIGMNIGGGIDEKDNKWYQYGHQYSYLKSKLGLK